MKKYSIIIPVYNRPDEVDELLESLTHQTMKDFDIIVVEDGSTVPCQDVVNKYTSKLDICYLMQENAGPGSARNSGAWQSKSEYLIILDSDVVVPTGFMEAVDTELKGNPCEAFGGPDAAHESFTDIQKAISYSMTSFFTTGGIRGGKKKLDKFYPRSFNMGIKRDVYEKLNGFSKMRFGEDIDFSYRIVENGCSCRLFPEAWVWHKRRTDFTKFFRQVFNSGIARINLEKRHPGTMKLVHMLPMMFTVGVFVLLLLAVILPMIYMKYGDGQTPLWVCVAAPLLPLAVYALLIMTEATISNHSLKVGILAIPAAFIQLTGYGLGFIKAFWLRVVLGQSEFTAFEKNFYK